MRIYWRESINVNFNSSLAGRSGSDVWSSHLKLLQVSLKESITWHLSLVVQFWWSVGVASHWVAVVSQQAIYRVTYYHYCSGNMHILSTKPAHSRTSTRICAGACMWYMHKYLREGDTSLLCYLGTVYYWASAGCQSLGIDLPDAIWSAICW